MRQPVHTASRRRPVVEATPAIVESSGAARSAFRPRKIAHPMNAHRVYGRWS